MRGIMNFDDYNYKLFNDYILLEEPPTEIGEKGKKQKSNTEKLLVKQPVALLK